MTADELIALRKRIGWSRAELARRLEVSTSRLRDFELGSTRGAASRAAPLPKLWEYAILYVVQQAFSEK